MKRTCTLVITANDDADLITMSATFEPPPGPDDPQNFAYLLVRDILSMVHQTTDTAYKAVVEDAPEVVN